jgi:glycerol dehydrogenase-like iron-containing ADH family enzyme
VDGYTDDVSVILRGGVKRTVPSRWPDVVIADAETIAGAPPVMNRAGYGEMTSMFTGAGRLAARVPSRAGDVFPLGTYPVAGGGR